MKLAKRWGLLLVVGCFLGAQSPADDPVMKARLQRSQAQGIDEADLPPVPRSVLEPPPLPPPETHAKDLPHPVRVEKAARRRGGKGKRGKEALPQQTRAAARHGAAASAAVPARPARPVKTARAARPARAAKPAGSTGKTARRTGKRTKS